MEATDKPTKIRLTISQKNVGAKAVRILEMVNNIKPNVMYDLRPFLSDSHPKKGAKTAYVIAKTVTIHPVIEGLELYASEINGSSGDTTNKSIPIKNKVIQPTIKLTLPCTSITSPNYIELHVYYSEL